MIDNAQAAQWESKAKSMLVKYLGKSDDVAEMASAVIALLSDREAWLSYVERWGR